MFDRACIISLNGAISRSGYSHRAHWPELRRLQLLESKWAKEIDLQPPAYEVLGGSYDAIIYYWGLEWGGALNLYGGTSDDNAERLFLIVKISQGPISQHCLDIRMPDIGALAKARSAPSASRWARTDWVKVTKACEKVQTLAQPLEFTDVVIGDSHAGSQYKPGRAIWRNDFKTLHGVLSQDGGLEQLIPPWAKPRSLKMITWYFGNIDLRHHLARQPDPGQAALQLVRAYTDQVEGIRRRQGGTMAIVAPLPIEPETRSIPKTGWHKGTPFYGDWATRSALREIMVRELRACCGRYGFEVIQWPGWFQDETGAMRERFMEKPGSVHLAWRYRIQAIQDHNGKEY